MFSALKTLILKTKMIIAKPIEFVFSCREKDLFLMTSTESVMIESQIKLPKFTRSLQG